MLWFKKEDLILWLIAFIGGNAYIYFYLDMATLPLINNAEPIELTKLYSIGMVVYWLYYMTKPKKYMHGKEKGSARWGKPEEMKRVIHKEFKQNVLFTKTERMSLNTRKTRKNLNQIIVGGSGAGKSRFFAKPNLMQLNTSFIVTDPSGDLFKDTAKMLQEDGYEIKVFNLIDMKNSDYYNPFKYITKEADVLQLINNLIKNTGSGANSAADPFWEKAEQMLLQALFFYILEKGLPHERNFNMVLKLLQLAEPKEDDENYVSPLDRLFLELAKENPDHIAVKQYKNFKLAAGKTTKSILIAVAARFAPFAIDDLVDITKTDTIELDKIGDRKTALFIIIPDVDETFNFMVSMMYSQLFNILYYRADFQGYINDKGKQVKGRLKYHVRVIADEFANIGTIPNFDKLIATMRRREISVSVILQNLAQLKNLYDKTWESIIGNCDSFLFLGGNEWETLKYISEMLGSTTIDTKTFGKSMGKQGSTSQNMQHDGRELKKADELKNDMPDDKCILFIRGFHPFYSKKIILERHPNYSKLGDADDSNIYDIAEYRQKFQTKTKENIVKNIQASAGTNSNANNQSDKTIFIDIANTSDDLLHAAFLKMAEQYKDNPNFINIQNEVIALHRSNELTAKKFREILKRIEIEVMSEATPEEIDYPSYIDEEETILLFYKALEQRHRHNPKFKEWQQNFGKERESGAIRTTQDFMVWVEKLEKDINKSEQKSKTDFPEAFVQQVFKEIAKQHQDNPIFQEIAADAKKMFESKTYSHDSFIALIYRLERDVIEETIDYGLELENII